MKNISSVWVVYAVFDGKVQFIYENGCFGKLTQADLYTLKSAQAVCKKFKKHAHISNMYKLLTVPLDVAIKMTWKALEMEGE